MKDFNICSSGKKKAARGAQEYPVNANELETPRFDDRLQYHHEFPSHGNSSIKQEKRQQMRGGERRMSASMIKALIHDNEEEQLSFCSAAEDAFAPQNDGKVLMSSPSVVFGDGFEPDSDSNRKMIIRS